MNFQVGAVCFNLKVKCTGRLYGIDVTMYVAFGNVLFTDPGIKVDAFHVMVPFSMNLGVTEQPFVQSEVTDEQVGAHYGSFQYSAGKCGAGSFSFKIDAEVCNVKHISYIYVLQVEAYRIFQAAWIPCR